MKKKNVTLGALQIVIVLLAGIWFRLPGWSWHSLALLFIISLLFVVYRTLAEK